MPVLVDDEQGRDGPPGPFDGEPVFFFSLDCWTGGDRKKERKKEKKSEEVVEKKKKKWTPMEKGEKKRTAP